MSELLEIDHVWTRRGRIQVLKDVTVSVGSEVVAVIGLNGSGKTTLLRTVSGLTRPNRGSIRFEGQTISGRPAHEVVRRGLSYMQQSNQLFPQLSVDENLRLGGYLLQRGEMAAARDRVLDLFKALRLKLAVKAGNLSGGERQMLALGKTLMQKPKLLLLDEPTAGLAPAGIAGMYGALAAIKEAGLPILLVEQNVVKALEIADRVLVLYLGSVHAQIDVARARDDLTLVRRLMMGEPPEQLGPADKASGTRAVARKAGAN